MFADSVRMTPTWRFIDLIFTAVNYSHEIPDPLTLSNFHSQQREFGLIQLEDSALFFLSSPGYILSVDVCEK